ncbi:MAG: site-specific tyrosine recombinase XerC [bacterium ADurb.Bin429]|nr:MAG: site-specific tyrosine recombinase XerC [bacterium ADurb.Bin429]
MRIVSFQSASQLADDRVVVKGTKTDRVRVVLINASLAEALDRHRAATPHAQPTDWICGRADGSHHTPRHFTRYFERLATRLGLSITLHGLRHSHATTLIAAGVPVKAVSERLGHSTVVITQDIYAHVLPTMQDQAARAMEALWQG